MGIRHIRYFSGSSKAQLPRGVIERMSRWARWLFLMGVLSWVTTTRAVVLWSDLGTTLVHNTGAGYDILAGAVKEDESSTNTLYFKFRVNPLSDASTEEYFAAFELYEGDKERLGMGNGLKAWAYSAFRADAAGESHEGSDYVDFHSSRPEAPTVGTSFTYENPHRGIECSIVFKVQYVPGDDDLVTVWLNPDLGHGATEAAQPESLITRFRANATFNEIHLRHGGGGDGWIFSELAIATSFEDFVAVNGNESGVANGGLGREEPVFTFRCWQSEQGLPQDRVRTAGANKRGLPLGGNGRRRGALRRHAVCIFRFAGRVAQRARAHFVWRQPGGVWIGSAGEGLIRWQGGRLRTFTMADGLPSDSISALAEDGEGRVWIGTEAGLALWENGHLTTLKAAGGFKGKPITALFKDPKGGMWLGATGAGVFNFQAGRFIPLEDAATKELLQDPHCLLVWTRRGESGLACGR